MKLFDDTNSGMLLRFSIDEGGTFYNAEEPRETIPVDRFLPSTWNLAKDLDSTADAHHRRLCSDFSVPECGMNSCLDEGRKCCAKFHTKLDVKCMLNGEGNACNCSEKGPCHVDLQCNQNGQWGRGATPLEIWDENCGNCYGAGEGSECCNTCDDVKQVGDPILLTFLLLFWPSI